jgi:DNA helicase-2/ATP-dependent DNA helicase PcrA
MPLSATTDWRAFQTLFRTLHQTKTDWPVDMDVAIDWYGPQLQRIYDDAHVRLADLVQLRQIAATYPSRERFLTEMSLDPPAATSDESGVPTQDDDYFILSTIHSAKGQEWKAVYVLNVVDGCIPSDMSTGTSDGIEEERRLLYVAMTRARDHLHLLIPQRFYVHAAVRRPRCTSLTRFIPNALLPRFESCVWPVAAADDVHVVRDDSAPIVDISARVRALWS